MTTVRRRGRVNGNQTLQVTIPAATVNAAVATSFGEIVITIDDVFVHEIHPAAVIDASVAVTRAFLRTRWRWQPRTLKHILKLATLRG